MANINLIKGFNFEDGTSMLTCIFDNELFIYNSGTDVWDNKGEGLVSGATYGITKSKTYGILCSQSINTRSIKSDGTISQTTPFFTKMPYSNYIHYTSDRVYVGDSEIGLINEAFPRRVFYTDILEKDDDIRWGIEMGTDLSQTASDATVTSASAAFKNRTIKVGDPFFILDGSNAGTYYVDEVTDENTIELNRPVSNSVVGSKFWVGGNWFDVNGNLTGLGEYYGVVIAFDANTAWKFGFSVGKKAILGVKGTLSKNSIVSNHNGYTFWYHPSDGIVMYNGSIAKSITNKIDPVMKGMNSSMYDSVVGWPGTGVYKDHVYFYIGDTSFKVNGESFSLNKVIVDYNIVRNKFKLFEYNTAITCATWFVENNEDVVYLGTSDSLVLKFNVGDTDYNTTADDDSTLPIHAYTITHPIYPSGIEITNEFDKFYAIKDTGTAIYTKYKLHGNPNKDDSEWSDLISLKDKYEEVRIDKQLSRARGISFMIDEYSKDSSFEFLGFSIIYAVAGETFDDRL